mmetsp:Transcript_4055/g.12729  ORF Transcript_4055/g.12729 Transcript_4055/m.12729 type:complete len:164 (-) Transcript_4055:135-626(-)
MRTEGLRPGLVHYHAVMRACATPAHWPIAASMLQDARDEGIEPDTVALNAALAACERGGQSDEALLLLSEMEASPSAPPDRISYNTAIAACSRCGEWRTALRLLGEMAERAAAAALFPARLFLPAAAPASPLARCLRRATRRTRTATERLSPHAREEGSRMRR